MPFATEKLIEHFQLLMNPSVWLEQSIISMISYIDIFKKLLFSIFDIFDT